MLFLPVHPPTQSHINPPSHHRGVNLGRVKIACQSALILSSEVVPGEKGKWCVRGYLVVSIGSIFLSKQCFLENSFIDEREALSKHESSLILLCRA